jgi:hypothetical protein
MKNRGVSKSDFFDLLELLEWSFYFWQPVYGIKNAITICYHCKGSKELKNSNSFKSVNSMFLRGCLLLAQNMEIPFERIRLLDLYNDFNRLSRCWCWNQYENTPKRQMKIIRDTIFLFENFKDDQVGRCLSVGK